MNKVKFFRNTAIALAVAGPLTAAMATNGMVLEGYGPISTGMGGASQAIDHGNAGMAQNPATLSLGQDGSRLDAAVGILGPKVSASHPMAGAADSGGSSYTMPAVGYTRKQGAITYGFGVFAIGGMGTEYSANSWAAMGTGKEVRSELGVGNLIFPVSLQVNERLAVGYSFDLVWASMDMMMAVPTTALAPVANGGMYAGGSGNLGGAVAAGPAGPLGTATVARIDFSDDSKYSGAAKANGLGGKLGAVYKVNDKVTVGGSYTLKTGLSDMQTASAAATMSANNGFSDSGKITVKNFQWPSIMAIGVGWQASPALTLAADVKSIGWAEVMKDFKMRYDSAGVGGSIDLAMAQNWKDQMVINLGAAWKVKSELTLRAGMNIADNPIPDKNVNYLFPATIKSHYTLGAGYEISKTSAINASLVMAPAVEVTDPNGIKISHSQTNMQLMYSHRF